MIRVQVAHHVQQILDCIEFFISFCSEAIKLFTCVKKRKRKKKIIKKIKFFIVKKISTIFKIKRRTKSMRRFLKP
jgi:hypothetical protein